MKVELNKEQGRCTIISEPGDPVFSGNVNAAGESRLFYHVKNALNKQGHNFIKKRMWKDGHLVDDMQQYIRTKDGSMAIYNPQWAIAGADKLLRERGSLTLPVIDLRNP